MTIALRQVFRLTGVCFSLVTCESPFVSRRRRMLILLMRVAAASRRIIALLLPLGLWACGGGGSSSSAPAPGAPTGTTVTPASITQADASRLLKQTSFGPTKAPGRSHRRAGKFWRLARRAIRHVGQQLRRPAGSRRRNELLLQHGELGTGRLQPRLHVLDTGRYGILRTRCDQQRPTPPKGRLRSFTDHRRLGRRGPLNGGSGDVESTVHRWSFWKLQGPAQDGHSQRLHGRLSRYGQQQQGCAQRELRSRTDGNFSAWV